ncbi:MAG: hypothetical protein EXR47_06935 [Dehalococcoidia bacterium]|nr:hypothetical protein [Dehalococcoidia bacterium]
MASIVDLVAQSKHAPFFLLDVSPPRGAEPSLLEPLLRVEADAFSVAYNPSKSVRVDSLALAHFLQTKTGRPTVFNLATRDMNRLALQSHLLGAQLLGVTNVLIIKGDAFNEKELALVKPVDDLRPTELIAAIAAMNKGLDYRGLRLRSPTGFCVGATVDPSRPLQTEARLARRKVDAGARFLITQSVYRTDQAEAFLAAFAQAGGRPEETPVLFGLPIPIKDGVLFGDVPEQVRRDLAAGRPGVDMALEQLHAFRQCGLNTFYLMPPILKGGLRDYEATSEFIQRAKAS